MTRRTIIAATLALLGALTPTAGAQKKVKEPRRPKLAAGADTNDAKAYFNFGYERLVKEPEQAADAFYWATRLSPLEPDAYYARRIALHLSDPQRLLKYWSGDKRTIQSDDVRRIDTLYFRALMISPFFSQRLEHQLFEGVLDEIARQNENNGGGTATETRYEMDRYLRTAPASTRAWAAYSDGRFDDAMVLYTQAVKGAKENVSLRVDRGRLFFQMNQIDSALADFTVAIEQMRKRDKKDLIYVYDSKALIEHSIAVLHQRLGHTDLAKEALGRALQEDLSYSPAHLQLGFIALDAKDTATALTEMDLAVQLRGDDPGLHYIYGYALGEAGRTADAQTQLQKALELDPVFAAPHIFLGRAYEKSGKTAEALAEYRAFLAGASAMDPQRDAATARVTALASKGTSEDMRR